MSAQPCCPECGSPKLRRQGQHRGHYFYRCQQCKHPFEIAQQPAPCAVKQGKMIERVIAENLKMWRKLKGLSQQQLAEKANLDWQFIRRVESEGQSIPVQYYFSLIDAMGLGDHPRKLLEKDTFENLLGGKQ